MQRLLSDLINDNEIQDFRMFLYELAQENNRYLLRNDILLAFENFCQKNNKQHLINKKSSIYKVLNRTPELILSDSTVVLIHRYQMSRYRFYVIGFQGDEIEEISVRDLLDLRDHLVKPDSDKNKEKLHIDFLPFYDFGPNIKDVKSIGRGIEFLNKHMSSSLFQEPEKWNKRLFEFLKIHCLGDQQLLVNGSVAMDYQ